VWRAPDQGVEIAVRKRGFQLGGEFEIIAYVVLEFDGEKELAWPGRWGNDF
jgi:hypothetical protein